MPKNKPVPQIRYNKLRALCYEHGTSIHDLIVNKLGLSINVNVELNNQRNLSISTIDKICSYFKCQPCDIMEFDYTDSSVNQGNSEGSDTAL